MEATRPERRECACLLILYTQKEKLETAATHDLARQYTECIEDRIPLVLPI
jgi:hypothetical protein